MTFYCDAQCSSLQAWRHYLVEPFFDLLLRFFSSLATKPESILFNNSYVNCEWLFPPEKKRESSVLGENQNKTLSRREKTQHTKGKKHKKSEKSLKKHQNKWQICQGKTKTFFLKYKWHFLLLSRTERTKQNS